MYPRHMQMQEVSRVLVTDGLGFWLFADIFNSQRAISIRSFATPIRCPVPRKKRYRYPMETGDIRYQVFSSAPTETRQYEQQVVSVMTTQEQDKLCRTCIHTLSTDSQTPRPAKYSFECLLFCRQRGQGLLPAGNASPEMERQRIQADGGGNTMPALAAVRCVCG